MNRPLSYDVHTHIGVDTGFYLRGWWPYAATAQDLIQHMDANGIDRACTFPFVLASAFDPYAFADGQVRLLPGRVPYDRENDLLLRELRLVDNDQRLLPFAMFDPAREVAVQVERLERLQPQLAGLKVQATVIESPISALLDIGRPLMDFAAAHDLPVLVHTSIIPSDSWSQTRDCLRVARANPAIRFNLAHSLRFHEPSLRQAAELPNVWIDCSAHLAHCQGARAEMAYVAAAAERVAADYGDPTAVLEAVYNIIGDRYLWGSDSPFMSWVDDDIRALYGYPDEITALRNLPPQICTSMLRSAPAAWLYGGRDDD